MIVCQTVLIFVLFSFLGWLWETVYCTIKHGKWANRGFLYGPFCPIYGFGGVAVILLATLAFPHGAAPSVWWQVFLVSMVACSALEYFTHWLLETLFHAYWWDYTNVPFNLNGRICLASSLFFGAAGVAVVYVIGPHFINIFAGFPSWLVEVLALILIALISCDATLTISALTNFAHIVADMEKNLNDRMSEFVDQFPRDSDDWRAARDTLLQQGIERAGVSMSKFHKGTVARIRSFNLTRPKRETAHQLTCELATRVREHILK